MPKNTIYDEQEGLYEDIIEEYYWQDDYRANDEKYDEEELQNYNKQHKNSF